MKNLSHFRKTDIRFWQSGVFRQPYIVDGQRRLTKEWYARVKFRRKRAFFPLDTPKRAAAAAKARDIFLFLTVNGWPLRLRGIRRGLDRRRQQILAKLRSVPFLNESIHDRRGTQLRSGKSSPTSSDSPLTRQNSITNPAAGTNG